MYYIAEIVPRCLFQLRVQISESFSAYPCVPPPPLLFIKILMPTELYYRHPQTRVENTMLDNVAKYSMPYDTL